MAKVARAEERAAVRAEHAANAAAVAAADQIVKSPSDLSCQSYEFLHFGDQEKGNYDNNKERVSNRSIESVSEHKAKIFNNNHATSAVKARKVSTVSYGNSSKENFYSVQNSKVLIDLMKSYFVFC